MTAAKRRFLRMLCKAVLLVSLPLAGFVWALPEDSTMLMSAGVLTLLSLAVGFGAEYFASSTESEIYDLTQQLAIQGERRVHELEVRDEKLRQFDRIVSLLTEQNHTLRGKLIAVQVELQRKKGLLVQAAGEALSFEEAPVHTAYAARAH